MGKKYSFGAGFWLLTMLLKHGPVVQGNARGGEPWVWAQAGPLLNLAPLRPRAGP